MAADGDELLESLARRIAADSQRASEALGQMDAEMLKILDDQPFPRVIEKLLAHPELEAGVLDFIAGKLAQADGTEKKTEPTP